jgi:type I restriction enzyme, S subunit
MTPWRQADFAEVIQSRGAGASGLPQSEWTTSGKYPVIGQGAEYIEGWTDREDLVVRPARALVLYGGHTRRAKLVDHPFVPGPNVKILEPAPDLDAAFLFRYLEQLKIESRGYADHFPDVRRRRVPVPPPPEQRWIAKILDKADGLRAKRRAALAQLDTLTQSIFLDMFGDPATNPKGWPVVSVGNICEVKGGKRLPKGEEYSSVPTQFRYIRVIDLKGGRVGESALVYLKPEIQAEIARYVVNTGDVIISIAGSIGLVAAVPESLDGVNLTENAAKLVPRTAGQYEAGYLAEYLQTEHAQSQIGSHVGQVTIGKLALFRIEKLTVPLPPRDLQREFIRRIAAVNLQVSAQLEARSRLDDLFSSLQHRAFRGML